MAGPDGASRAGAMRPADAACEPSRRIALQPVVFGLAAIVGLVTGLAACASPGAPTWTFAPGPTPIMTPDAAGPVAATCPPGSNPDEPGPADQPRPESLWPAAFDRHAGRMTVLAAAQPFVEPRTRETWTLDVCTNAFARMHPDVEPTGSEWGRLVYDVDSDTTIAIGLGGPPWAYDREANTWNQATIAPPTGATAAAYDPTTGLVIVGDEAGLWGYDVDTDTWVPITPAPPQPGAILAYDGSAGRLIAYVPGPEPATWLLDLGTGTWSKSDADTPVVVAWMTGPSIVYDEAAERTVASGNWRIAAFDATAGSWAIVADEAGVSTPLVYDALNRRLVGQRDDDLVAFDLTAREWTVLLEAIAGRPAGD